MISSAATVDLNAAIDVNPISNKAKADKVKADADKDTAKQEAEAEAKAKKDREAEAKRTAAVDKAANKAGEAKCEYKR